MGTFRESFFCLLDLFWTPFSRPCDVTPTAVNKIDDDCLSQDAADVAGADARGEQQKTEASKIAASNDDAGVHDAKKALEDESGKICESEGRGSR